MHFCSIEMKFENNMLLQRILKMQSKNKTRSVMATKHIIYDFLEIESLESDSKKSLIEIEIYNE